MENKNNHINHSKLDFSCGAGAASINVYTGRLLFERSDISIGANSFNFGVSHIYDSQPYKGIDTCMGNGWKLNIQQYIMLSDDKDENKVNLYRYIDGSGYTHQFEKYGTENGKDKYFDRMGSGLTLWVNGSNYYIEDTQGEKLQFDFNSNTKIGKLTQIVSSINSKIIKKIEYDDSGKPKAIFDNRNSLRRIEFVYGLNDMLTRMDCVEVGEKKYSVLYNYDANGNLASVKESADGISQYTVVYSYTGNRLKYAVRVRSSSSLKFEYDETGRVISTNNGIMKTLLHYSEARPALYASHSVICGTPKYCGQAEREFLGYSVSQDDNDYTQQTADSKVSYSSSHTTIENGKGIKTSYFFNLKGFTTAILEETKTNEFRTLSKTSGWDLMDADSQNSTAKFNGKNVLTISDNNFTVPTSKRNVFKDIFGTHKDNSSNKKHKFTHDFAVSFWLRTNANIQNSTHPNAKIAISTSNASYSTFAATAMLDKTPANSWQYVTIPISFSDIIKRNSPDRSTFNTNVNSAKIGINNMQLSFSGLDTQIQIADLRIAESNYSRFSVGGGNKFKSDFSRAVKICYTGNEEGADVNSNFFMTESDVFSTCKNMYYQGSPFEVVYCGGTKRLLTTELWWKNSDNEKYNFYIHSNGVPEYFGWSESQIDEDNWCITKTRARFNNENGERYAEQKTSVDKIKANSSMDNLTISDDSTTASNSYIWTNHNGTHRASKDAYNVITHNYYDNFGNITKVCVYKEGMESGEKLTKEISYGDVSESHREAARTITENGITRVLTYNEPFMQPDTLRVTGGDPAKDTQKYEYNVFGDQTTKISAINGNSQTAYNSLTYDDQDRLKDVSDQNGRKYGFEYNQFGDVTKYKAINANGTTDDLLTKAYTYDYGSSHQSKVTETYLSGGGTKQREAVTDKYGKVESVIDDGKRTVYHYQGSNASDNPYAVGDPRREAWKSHNESLSIAQITQINDPYDGQTYNYHYDNENRAYSYSTSGSGGTGAVAFTVRQADSSKTEYTFPRGTIRMSTVKNEDDPEKTSNRVYIEPRVHKTVDEDAGFEDAVGNRQKTDFAFIYEYDHLGRLHKKIADFDSVSDHQPVETIYSYRDGTTQISKVEHSCPYTGLYNETLFKRDYIYDDRGNIRYITDSGNHSSYGIFAIKTEHANFAGSIEYRYNNLNRLTYEKNTRMGIERNYSYMANGRLITTSGSGGTKSHTYDSFGRATGYTGNGDNLNYGYDIFGNVNTVTRNGATVSLSYTRGNLLSGYGGNTYEYNHQGVRFKKTVGSQVIQYINDGSRILDEDRTEGGHLRYFYDATGITGVRHNNENYKLVRDGQGHVVKVLHINHKFEALLLTSTIEEKLMAEYDYDAFGNCKITAYDSGGKVISNPGSDHIANLNPFRWKSHYYDSESQMYYLNGRYYNPVIGHYVDADTPENLLTCAFILNALDRNAVTVDNIISAIPNTDSIFTASELSPDPRDENADKSWWEVNWKKAIQWIIFAAVLLVSVILMCIPGTQAFGIGMFTAGMKAAISGYIIGGAIGGLMALVQGNDFWEGIAEGAVYGFINGFSAGAIMFCISQGIGAVANAVKAKPTAVAAADDAVGTYKFRSVDGKEYIGKGPRSRMETSIKRIESEFSTKIIQESKTWVAAADDTAAFIKEAKWMNEAASKGTKLYNKIASPGHKLGNISKKILRDNKALWKYWR